MVHNYHCCENDCSYKTTGNSEAEAEKQLIEHGGCDVNKVTLCPLCKQDSLVFVPNSFK